MSLSQRRGRERSVSIAECFAELPDPRRRQSRVTHPLVNIVTLALCAVLCGADDFVSIAEFGRVKKKWLSQFLDLSAGVPSHDCLNRVFAALNVHAFQQCLLKFITALHEVSAGQVVAIDGKTLRRSFDRAHSKSAIHMVSAWASANHVSLGQVVVDEKSNEITAIPQLLKILEIHGCLVTIDALGCQVEIAQQIVDSGADYVLAVKRNQRTLSKGVDEFFATRLDNDFSNQPVRRCTTRERGHGREETREYYLCPVPPLLPDRARWSKLAAIGMVVSTIVRDGRESMETRFYILSKYLSAKRFAAAVRGHWSIENRLHWQLDVTFQEDQCRLRKGRADANFSSLRRATLTLLKNNHAKKLGLKNKRLAAALDENYLAEILLGP